MTTLSPAPKMQFFMADGTPLVGGKVYTYAGGTTTPLATYTDSTGSQSNPNPVILDSRGEANIWLAATTYKFKLTDSDDVEIWTVDNIASPISSVSPVFGGGVVIDANSATTALRITQTGSGNAFLVEDSTSPDATPFVITNSGLVGVGTATPSESFDVATGAIQLSSGAVPRSRLSATGAASTLSAEGSRSLIFSTDSTDQVTITNAGYMGVGVSAPGGRLHVGGDAFVNNRVLVNEIVQLTTGSGTLINGVLCKNNQVAPENRVITQATTQSLSGSSVSFTSIPSWVKRITVVFAGATMSGSDQLLIQIGPSSGVVTSGYGSSSAGVTVLGPTAVVTSSTAGFIVYKQNATTLNGVMTIYPTGSSDNYVASHAASSASAAGFSGGGVVSSPGGVSIVRLRPTGTNTFSGGEVTLFYE